mgnify:FL=1
MTMKPKLIIGPAARRRADKEKRDLMVYEEANAAIAAGSLVTDVCAEITRRYNISKCTFYAIRKRVEHRMRTTGKEAAV